MTTTEIAVTVFSFNGNSVVFKTDSINDALWENTNYTLTVLNLPTPASELDMSTDLNSIIVGVGLSTTGGLSHSSSAFNNFRNPSFTVKSSLKLLTLNRDVVTIKRGTYSNEEICF